jgi:23S rRNA pseudouridine955/2504/2580 synthase/23S rRNA pseudouridine1911/1915/1917 synthase
MSRPPSKLHIVHDDADLIAVEKPAGLAVIPGRGEKEDLLHRLADQTGLPASGTGDPRLRIVHRLDKDTSGVLLLAKHIGAQRCLSEQFQNNRIEKEYLALVVGRPDASEGEIDAPLAPHPTSPRHMAISRHGRPARTAWRVEERFRHYALLRVFPRTGKTHQIRVHLAHIGLPLAIDPLYNPPSGRSREGAAAGIFLSHFKLDYRPTRGEEERPLIDRLTLHAEKLTFVHPNGARMTIECPPPKDFRAVLTQLRNVARR